MAFEYAIGFLTLPSYRTSGSTHLATVIYSYDHDRRYWAKSLCGRKGYMDMVPSYPADEIDLYRVECKSCLRVWKSREAGRIS